MTSIIYDYSEIAKRVRGDDWMLKGPVFTGTVTKPGQGQMPCTTAPCPPCGGVPGGKWKPDKQDQEPAFMIPFEKSFERWWEALPMPRTREEHLAWCKKRALKYLDQHDVQNAICSMLSDMKEHPETPVNDGIAMLGIMYATQQDEGQARYWIEGFR